MKILFFIHSLGGGGAERIATILLNHLCEKNEVYVAVTAFRDAQYPLDNRVKVIDNRVKCKIKGAHRILKYGKILKAIKSVNPDVIISFIVEMNGDVLLTNLLTKKKIIVSERTTILRPSFYRRLIRRWLYRLATHIVFVTKQDCELSNHIKSKSFIYNPMHLTPIDSVTKREQTIVAIGPTRRWKVKGFDILIDAWSKISKLYPDWKLEIIGTIAESPIQKLISELNIEKQVSFIDWQKDIESTLKTKSIFVLSSRYEGFPNSLLEAMSQGCACIATNCPSGPKEIITDGISGLIAETENADDIALKIKTLIDNQELREKLSAGAIEEAKRFDKNHIMKQWDDLIESIAIHNS